jgi:hypothetical protein
MDLAELARRCTDEDDTSNMGSSETFGANKHASTSSLSTRGRSNSEDEASTHPLANVPRSAVFSCCKDFQQLQDVFGQIVSKIDMLQPGESEPVKLRAVNAVHLVILQGPYEPELEATQDARTDESKLSEHLGSFLSQFEVLLANRGIRRVTIFLCDCKAQESALPARKRIPAIFTFRTRLGFSEDALMRHIEPPHAFHLDLLRLSNFDISLADAVTSQTGNVHIYQAVPKTQNRRAPLQEQTRFFARLVTFTADAKSSDMEQLFVEALEALTMLVTAREAHAADSNWRPSETLNHIFVSICAPDVVVEPGFYESELKRMVNRYGDKLSRVRVRNIEVNLTVRLAEHTEPVAIRFVIGLLHRTMFIFISHQAGCIKSYGICFAR